MKFTKKDLIVALAAMTDGNCSPSEIRDHTGFNIGQCRWISKVATACLQDSAYLDGDLPCEGVSP